jgi:hypothetical protein
MGKQPVAKTTSKDTEKPTHSQDDKKKKKSKVSKVDDDILFKLTLKDSVFLQTAVESLNSVLVDGSFHFLSDEALKVTDKVIKKDAEKAKNDLAKGKKDSLNSTETDADDSSSDESTKKKKKKSLKYTSEKKARHKSKETDAENSSDEEEEVTKKKKKKPKLNSKETDAENSSDEEDEDSDLSSEEDSSDEDEDESDSDSDNDDDVDKGKKKKRNREKKSELPFNGGMVKMLELNTTKSVMVYMKLAACEFHEFYCAEPIQTISFNFQTLNIMLKNVNKNDDVVSLILRRSEPDNLIITARNNDHGKNDHGKNGIYRVPLSDSHKPEFTYTEEDFTSMVTMPSQKLQSFCRTIKDFTQFMEIKSVNGQITFKCKGDGVIEETLGKSRKKKGKTEVVQGIYETKHLASASKCQKLSRDVSLFLRNEWPIVVSYTFLQDSKICFWISPVNVKPHESLDSGKNELSDLSDDDDDSTKKGRRKQRAEVVKTPPPKRSHVSRS